ncbi:MAG TPA: hypothetical protein VFV74_00560 [Burkholderiales bacterium]|nr:hypothetical protein [Burkholderiales bacterium]
MACYIIGCSLKAPGRDYVDLVEAIGRVGSAAWPCLDSTWVVNSDKTPSQIRDELKLYLEPTDELIVAELAGNAAWKGLRGGSADALKAVLAG